MAIDGTYQTSAESPMGKIDAKLTIVTDGDTMSGNFVTDMMGTVEFSGGTVNGDSFSVQMTADTPMGQMEMTYTGTVDGDSISGEIQTGMGNMSFAGNRI